MTCPECGSPFGRHRGGCRRGAVDGIAEFWRPLGWIGRLFAAAMYIGVLLFFGQVLHVVGEHNFDLSLVLAVGGLAIIVVMSVYIKVCFVEGLRFFFSRAGALGAVLTTLLWALWYLVYLAGLSMKPGGEHPILAILGRTALAAPVILCFFLLFVGGGIAVFVAVRSAIKAQPKIDEKTQEPYLAQELPRNGKALLTGFVLVAGILLGYGAWQGVRDIYPGPERASTATPNRQPANEMRPQPFQDNNPASGTMSSNESPDCNVGNFTADAGTLHLFPPEINKATGEMVVNGVDSARPSTPFRFIWGDGTMTLGWFPQRRIYKTPSYGAQKGCYRVWVVATHQDESTVEAAWALSP
jgi:hypothetical protein